MPALWRVIAVFVGVATVAVLEMGGGVGDATFAPVTTPRPSRTSGGRSAVFGVSSCFGATCHGQTAERAADCPNACAATLWIDHDRHSRAFEVLTGAEASRIMKALNPKDPTKAGDDARCLACHTNPKRVYDASMEHIDTSLDVVASRREGVNCETCHGDPANWLLPHVTWRLDEPPERLREMYEKKGMTWLNDLNARAERCAGCHVGAPEDRKQAIPRRDVSHDLIAAGHPRLVFEFASYLRNMPPHWKERDRGTAASKPSVMPSAAQFWVAGQRACHDAAKRLLEDSQARPDWPEFARFNCFACHHDLEAKSWRRSGGGVRPGRLVPDTWDYFVSSRPPLEDAFASVDRKNPSDAIHLLRTTLLEFTSDHKLSRLQWDHAAQIYLALAAWKEATSEPAANMIAVAAAKVTPTNFETQLQRLGEALVLPEKFNSPKAYDPEKIAPILQSLRKMIENGNENNGPASGG